MTESNQGEERRVLMMALSLNATMFVVGIVASVIAKSTLDGAQQGDSAGAIFIRHGALRDSVRSYFSLQKLEG